MIKHKIVARIFIVTELKSNRKVHAVKQYCKMKTLCIDAADLIVDDILTTI